MRNGNNIWIDMKVKVSSFAFNYQFAFVMCPYSYAILSVHYVCIVACDFVQMNFSQQFLI
jgi:hypothetical protein